MDLEHQQFEIHITCVVDGDRVDTNAVSDIIQDKARWSRLRA
jgi:hypothetical protein